MTNTKISTMLHDFNVRFTKCISDMATCSFDPEYKNSQGVKVGFKLVDSPYRCYNFDEISEQICKEHGYDKLQSVDSILPILPLPNDKLYLIEFKNNRSNIPWADVRAKILNSLLFFQYFYKIDIKDFTDIVTITVKYSTSKYKHNLNQMRKHLGLKIGSEADEVEHFKILKDMYGIISYKFDSIDFIEFLEQNNLV